MATTRSIRCGWRRLRAARAQLGERADAARGLDAASRSGHTAQQSHIGGVAPPTAEPVEVLMKSAPAWMAISAARNFSSMVSREVSERDLEPGAQTMAASTAERTVCSTAAWLPLLSWQWAAPCRIRARPDEEDRGFLKERGNQRTAERRADDRAVGMPVPESARTATEAQTGFTSTQAKRSGQLRRRGLPLLARGAGLEQRVVDDGGEEIANGRGYWQ